LPEFVVRIQHRNFGCIPPRTFEEMLFCGKIILERFVEIHVLARQGLVKTAA